MLRDGHYVSERDVMMKVQGVYVEASSRLHAVLEPAQHMTMRLEAHDAQEQSSDYRSASAQLQSEFHEPLCIILLCSFVFLFVH